jgi:hypothetical protein
MVVSSTSTNGAAHSTASTRRLRVAACGVVASSWLAAIVASVQRGYHML